MSQRITPLTRNQLLELEALVRNLISAVTQQHVQPSATPASVGEHSWPLSAPSTPTSVSLSNSGSCAKAYASTPLSNGGAGGGLCAASSFPGALHDAQASPLPVAAPSDQDDDPSSYLVDGGVSDLHHCLNHPQPGPAAAAPADHAVLHGAFVDVFADPWTATTWRLYDKIEYIVWWSYRPPSCTKCGMQDAWMPSGDVEFQCAFCLSGAGTTRSNAIVEDTTAAKQDHAGMEDSGDDDDDTGGFAAWLQRIPLLGPAGPISAATVGGSGNRVDGAARPANQRTPASSSTNGTGTHAGSLPMVLRAAYDMGTLLTIPGLPRGTAPGLRAAALYLSLLLHRFVSLFPLFCLAGRIPASAAAAGATASATVETSQHRGPHKAAGAETHCADVELQWVDVELISALLGVSAPSFFESTEVSLQHLQNVFTVAAAYGVPSVLWHPGRVPGRVETMKALKEKMEPLCPVPFAAAGVSGLCPEHTAMIVALELARRVDAQPIAVSSTSPAAAAQNAQRIGMWFDALGLYPTRRAYRDAHSYHQYVVAAEKRQDSGDGAADGDAAQDRHGILASWEKTLTELAGMKDPQLLAAAERHARRHDGNVDRAKQLFLTTSTSPFYKRFEWILTSPCANALLHVFAAVFRMTPMELADMALRSGIYQGPTSGFVATLRTAVLRGAYDVMPLARRLSPLTSSWMCTYMALHSGDRLPLLTALRQLNDAQNSTRDRQAALTRLVQRVLRKHQAPQLYQLNFVLRVTDEVEKHFNGVYFLSSVLWQEGLAIFTCLRSGRKTITLNRYTNRMSLCYMNAKEKHVDHLSMHVVPPVVAAVETEATRLVMEMALGISTASVGDPWGNVVRSLDKCARVRRRMRVPMLASRLDALASIREHASTVARQLQQFPSFFGGAGGQLISMGPTLLGWGDAETLLASAPPLDVQQLRRDLQWNYLCLPHVSLLAGLSEDRVVAMYASLVGLLELIHLRLVESVAAASANSTAAALSNWVEELLYVDDEEQRMQAEVDSLQQGFGSAAATGWSPPAYRNSHSGTPKLSRSPKSKFLAVSASTNAPLALHNDPALCGTHPQPYPALFDGHLGLHTLPQRRLDADSASLAHPAIGLAESTADIAKPTSNLLMLKKKATEVNTERQRCDDVMRLLRQALPPYWEDRRARRPGPTTASRPTRRGEGGSAGTGRGAGALELPSEVLITHKPFNVFHAEECRRRLRRLYSFISTYERRRIVLLQLAAEGKLPKMATARQPPRSPKLHNGSPLTPVRAAATAAGVGFSTPLRLSPPPRLASPSLPPKPAGGDGGTAAAQRSPPHCQQVSPPIRTAAPQPRQRGDAAAGGDGSPRPSQSLSPVSSSQSSRRSPRRQHQHRSPSQQSSARLKSAQKSASGLSGSVNPSKQRSNKHTFGDVAWQESRVRAATLSRGAGVVAGKGAARRAERVSGGGEQDRRTSPPGRWCDKPPASENGDNDDEERPSNSNSDVEREGDSHACRQPLSFASSEDDEQQWQTPSMQVMQPRKRWRASSDHEDSGKGADEDHPRRRTESRNGDGSTYEALCAEEQHRRKAKKTGRRRRRQEQTLQQHQQRKQVSSRSPLHSHEPSKDDASCSPEVRAGRGGPGSVGSVSSRTGSPGLPPRPSRAEMEVKGSPVTPSQAVSSIRARAKRSAYAAAASAAPVGDADTYDADTN
ncbi:hypothetical protein CGC20_38540 [Leishmania donovani]|uniref:Uncharacterized protein n=1 Tax=Leishmania donovani TaxID=5661 RepID=A0A504Y0D5_LEIDO|nr:hypothetical protein CGC20_38540 [Leishmania donovani]